MRDRVDVVLVTALPMELIAAKTAFTATEPTEAGVGQWHLVDKGTPLPYEVGDYHTAKGSSFRVAIARASRMGSLGASSVATTLSDRLRPTCLVMTGVCAGNPKDLALGDIVLSEIAYQYDEGKRTAEAFVGDHRQSAINPTWLRLAQDFDITTIPSYGEPSPEDARFWLLEQLHRNASAKTHPARSRYFGQGAWAKEVATLEQEGLVAIKAGALLLTDAGRTKVERSLLLEADPPLKLPMAALTGPIASGNVVVKDGVTWDSLSTMGVRSALGLEMEAATIGLVAAQSGVTNWIVIKGVMDHADPNKDDRFKAFAARTSGEVMAQFLENWFDLPVPTSDVPADEAAAPEHIDYRGIDYHAIAAAVQKHAPRHVGLIGQAKRAAERGYLAADEARRLAGAVRQDLGQALLDLHAGIKQGEIKTLATDPASGVSGIAKIWDSGDEYLGQAATGNVENGHGVWKTYKLTKQMAELSTEYAGEATLGEYGEYGVHTFPDRSQFAGQWTDGNPFVGMLEVFGDDASLDCDLYLGRMGMQPDGHHRRWFPHGAGVAIDLARREITCGEFSNGGLMKATAESPFRF